ncbi:MAG: HD domain-containing protein [Phototrophicaceae bacterium]
MSDLTGHKPQFRTLLWSDNVLDIQEALIGLNLTVPLYIIGGAVRDAFLHFPVKDIDLATPTDSIKVARKIANAFDGDIFVMDAERGVARVLVDTDEGKLTLDIANFRGDTLMDDIIGRDFTINAMAVDMLGDLQLLIDPLDGETDAMQKVVRRCSEVSIADDPIRALRAVRQSTHLKFRIEPETLKDIHAHGAKLLETSPERVRDEFFKILGLKRSSVALKVVHALGLLRLILPEITALEGKELPDPHVFDGFKQAMETVENLVGIMNTISYRRSDSTAASFAYGMLAMQLDRYRTELNEHLALSYPNERTHSALLVLAGLLHRVDNAHLVIAKVADDLRLSNPEKKYLMATVAHYAITQTIDYNSALDVHRFWFPLGDKGIDAILLGLADYLAMYGNELIQDDWLIQVERALMLFFAYYSQFDTVISPEPLLNGNDLMQELDLDGGRIIGDLLTHLREAQILGEITNRDDALQLAKQYLQ